LNRDGILDLAVVNQADTDLRILLGVGDGTFNAAAADPATGATPVAIAIGDLNRDGILDLAVVNQADTDLRILLGVGDGTFNAAAADPGTGFTPNAIAIGDLNRDGILDLAVVNQADTDLRILLGVGDGTFNAAAADPGTGFTPNSIAVGDIDRDGDLDLTVTNQDADTVSVFLGIGDGTFTLNSSPSTGQTPRFIVIGDLDGDGDLDLAVANSADDTVSILRNTPQVPPTAAAGGGGGGGGGGCFIATAAFGSPLAPQVQLLRAFRDLYLLPHPAGEAFVALYYRLSPPLAEQIAESEILRAIVRVGLVPVIGWVTLFLWSPILGLGIPLVTVGLGGWLPLRAARRREHNGANHSVPQAKDEARSRRAALWRRLALWSCFLLVLSAPALLKAGQRDGSKAGSRVELVGDVKLPQTTRFALIRDPESAHVGLYKDGEPIFEGQSPLPLGKIAAVHDHRLIVTLPSGQAVEIPEGARLPGPHGLIFVRSALIDTLRFQIHVGGADKPHEDYSVVDILGRHAILQRDVFASKQQTAAIAEMVNRIPLVEVAPDTWEIPGQSVKELGDHLGPFLNETLRSASPIVTLKDGVGLKLHNSLGSGTLDRRGFRIDYARLARRTGLKVGDVILSVNGQPVNSVGGLVRIYRQLKSDSSVSDVKVVIERNNKSRTLTYHIR
ncbi:MAG: FG-GAP-like repeat-containing protein, partial [Candidatus Methylomirabilales bacterium]